MVNLLKKEMTRRDMTTIVVSHNRSFLEAADVILIIDGGKIVYNGDLEGAVPLLEDLSVCTYRNTCEGDHDAECFR
jgi:Fe-S cluster assembly ATP-binding protein